MTAPWIVVIVALWLAVVAIALAGVGILRRILPILEREAATYGGLPALPTGTAMPPFRAILGDGTDVTTAHFAGKPFVLLFVRHSCQPCQRLLRQLRGGEYTTAGVAIHAVIDPARSDELPLPAGISPLYEPGGGVSRAFQVSATPLAVAVDASGIVVGSAVPRGPADLDKIIGAARTGSASPTFGHHRPASIGRRRTFIGQIGGSHEAARPQIGIRHG